MMKSSYLNELILKNKILLRGSAASMIARIVTVITMMITIGIATRKMTSEEFGLWTILYIIMNFSLILDFGFRFGLGNRLAAWVAQSNYNPTNEQAELFLSIFYFTGIIALIFTIIYSLSFNSIQWNYILKIQQSELIENSKQIFKVVIICLLLNIPFTLSTPGFFAFREISLASEIIAVQSIMLLVLFVITFLFFPYKYVIIFYFITYLITNIISTFWFLRRRGWRLKWISLAIQYRHIKSISNRSLEFFLLSSSSALVASLGTFLAGNVAGLSKAGDFNLVQRIFNLFVTIHLAMLAPLGPEFTQNAHLGKWDTLNRKFSFCKYKIWPVWFIVGGGLVYLFHPIIMDIWTGRVLSNYYLAGLIALTAILGGWSNTQSILLNSLGLVKWQAAISIILVPFFVFLPLYLGRMYGITGVAGGTLICMVPGTFFWPIYSKYAIKMKLIKI